MQNTHNKVCLVATSLAKGGAERSCALLSRMLYEKGYNVHIVTLNDEIDYAYSGTLYNLGIEKKISDSQVRRFFRFRKFRAFLKKENFDVIIDHRPKNEFYRELFYASYIYKGFKRIYVVHSSNFDTYLGKKPELFLKFYNQSIKTIAVAKAIETKLNTLGINNTITIQNAFDDTMIQNAEMLPENLTEKKYLLSYGRLNDAIKDISFLIDSFTLSEVWKKRIYLVIMGDGKDLDMLKAKAAKRLSSKFILFIPFKKNPFSIIKNARAVTLTSHYEGFPMVLVESLSIGTPVISIDINSGPSEIVRHQENGLLIEKRSLPLFAEALKKMCVDEAFYELCKENSKPSVAHLEKNNIAEKWHQLLQNEL